MELWVIEAPGKAQALEAILQRLGLEARVQATKGHIMTMPERLTPMGIDCALHEFLREPRDIDVVRRIRDLAREANRVVVATDADGEGDVIAWDVATLTADLVAEPVRVRLRGMDDDSVREAILAGTAVLKRDAIAGRTRGIVDRLIGGAFSGNGVAVGRVGTALLGLVASGAASSHKLYLSAPARDGGRPWLAECDIKAPLTRDIGRQLVDLALPVLDMESSHPFTAAPGHMGDIMIRASEKLEISPTETAKAMQRTYESGRLSYPRAGSRGMSRSAARKMRKILENANSRFDDSAVAEKSENEVHDAPHPLGAVNLSLDPRKMGSDEGVRAMIARDLVRTGMRHVREMAFGEPIRTFLIGKGFPSDVAACIAGLEWRREQGPRYPDQASWGVSQIVHRRPDAVLLEAAMHANLGRPSTWANHIDGFLARGLVDDDFNLTRKGQEWVAASPQGLMNPLISAAIEKACERVDERLFSDPSREPWEVSAQRILAALPPELTQTLGRITDAEKPRPRRDFRAMAEPGIDLDNLLQVSSPAYVPGDGVV